MKVLFSLRNLWYVKHYDLVLRELARRGHAVSVITEPLERNDRSWVAAAEWVARDCPAVRFEQLDKRADDVWFDLATTLRWGSDYLRFLNPLYDRAPKLRERAEAEAPRPVKTLAGWAKRFGAAGLVRRLLDLCERAVPLNQGLQRRVAEEAPDVVILSPLIALGTSQIDVLRTARRLGMPTVLAVGSWDHLSSKGLVREIPDQVFVWNDVQRREAIELHGVPADRVVVTGAQAFDHWFEWRARSREEFLSGVGLPADRPYVMYACSCLINGSPIEAEFVYEWVKGFRSSSDLRDASILIRPHPKRDAEFDQIDLSAFPNVAVWPRGVVGPVSDSAKADYFDSLYHSEAVVGLNTSAFIEAGIVGRPVLTPLLPEFWENQEGTLHFRYLLETAGGLLQTSRSLDEHYAQLIRALDAEQDPDASGFLDAFVHSPEKSRRATDVFVDAAERAANSRPIARSPDPVPLFLRPALYPLARFIAATSSRAERQARQRALEARARTRQAEQRQRREARLAYEAAQQRQREEERRVKEEAKNERERVKRDAREEERRLKEEEERLKEEARNERWRIKREARDEEVRLRREARDERILRHQAAREAEHAAEAQVAEQAKHEREQQRAEELARHRAAKREAKKSLKVPPEDRKVGIS